MFQLKEGILLVVPNAPCGVERSIHYRLLRSCVGFLMHRVELKGCSKSNSLMATPPVPNAPCGVESWLSFRPLSFIAKFLMHRVELKESSASHTIG